MSRQYFADTLIEPVNADFATITATTETVLVDPKFTPIQANEPRAGKVYELLIGGTVTTGTAGTLIITVRHALTATTPILATSATQNYVPSITTAPFLFRGYLIYRSIGLFGGTNSTAIFTGEWHSGGAVATAASETAVSVGTVGAAIAVDTSVATGLWVGVTFSVAPSVIPKWHTWRSLN